MKKVFEKRKRKLEWLPSKVKSVNLKQEDVLQQTEEEEIGRVINSSRLKEKKILKSTSQIKLILNPSSNTSRVGSLPENL